MEAVATTLGCPVACHALGTLSREWNEVVTSGAAMEHNDYRCCRSRRRILVCFRGEAAPPEEGMTPAAFSGLWRRRSRELDTEGCRFIGFLHPLVPVEASSASSASGPVRCPVPGCDHEEPTAELAACHAETCCGANCGSAFVGRVGSPGSPLAGRRRGFRYAAPEEVAAARRRMGRQEVAEVILDSDFGDCARSASVGFTGPATERHVPAGSPVQCMCEIDEQAPALLLREISARALRIRLDTCTGVHRGWQLSDAARRAYERGAFPRAVDLVVFSGRYDNTYDYYTSRLSGWAFSPRTCRRLLSPEAWDRTLVVKLRAAPEAEKQRRLQKLMQRWQQGTFDKITVYVLGLMGDASILDSEFPSSSAAWRIALRRALRTAGSDLSAARRSEAERLLAASCPAVQRKDIAAEYADCKTDFLFISFVSQQAAERFHQHLSAAVARADDRQSEA